MSMLKIGKFNELRITEFLSKELFKQLINSSDRDLEARVDQRCDDLLGNCEFVQTRVKPKVFFWSDVV